MAKKLTYTEWVKAYETAMTQRHNHDYQVSGAWGINGYDFCEKYGLDDTSATQRQDEDNAEWLNEELMRHQAEARRLVGDTLTDEQYDNIQMYVENNYYYDRQEEYAYWDDIVWQLTRDYREYNKRYYEDEERLPHFPQRNN